MSGGDGEEIVGDVPIVCGDPEGVVFVRDRDVFRAIEVRRSGWCVFRDVVRIDAPCPGLRVTVGRVGEVWSGWRSDTGDDLAIDAAGRLVQLPSGQPTWRTIVFDLHPKVIGE